MRPFALGRCDTQVAVRWSEGYSDFTIAVDGGMPLTHRVTGMSGMFFAIPTLVCVDRCPRHCATHTNVKKAK